MKRSHLFSALALAITATACTEATNEPITPAVNRAVVASSGNYVILASGNKLPADLAARITAAGGTLNYAMGEIGVATASSSDANFAANASKIAGIKVVPDLTVAWGQPTRVIDAEGLAESIEADAALSDNEVYAGIQWHLRAVDAAGAWATGARGTGVRVAVLDGGIHATHPDLRTRVDVARSISFAPTPFNHDLGTFWHGTHVAGIIAAADDNASSGNTPAGNAANGAIGIAPGATIIGVKVLHGGTGDFGWMISGLYYASTPIAEGGAGADIINMSLGADFDRQGPAAADLIVAINRALNYASQQGVAIFASAGNDGYDLDHTNNLISVPAQLPHVITISATAPLGFALGATNWMRPASYTNFGRSAIDLSGPGGDTALPGNALCTMPLPPFHQITNVCWVFDAVLSTSRGTGGINTGGYSWAAGTSMSSPAAAAVAALIVEKHPGISPAQLEAKLRASALNPEGNGNDPYLGRGFVNAARAVQQ